MKTPTLAIGSGGDRADEHSGFSSIYDGRERHFTLETLPHSCAVKNAEVLKGVCLNLRSDAMNRITVCEKYGCSPPWLKQASGGAHNLSLDAEAERARKNAAADNGGRAEGKVKTPFSLPKIRGEGKAAKAKKPDDTLKAVEADPVAAEAALADIRAEGAEEVGAETLVLVPGDGEDEEAGGVDAIESEIDAAVVVATRADMGVDENREDDGAETSVSTAEDDSGTGEGPSWGEEVEKIPPSILEGAVLMKIPVDKIYPNPEQPREFFDKEKLGQLRKNLRKKNQKVPVTVIRTEQGFELVDGERRWLSAKAGGLQEVFAIVLVCSDIDIFEEAAIANLGREGHTPMEYAKTAAKLIAKLEKVVENGKPLKRGVINERVAVALCMSVQTMLNYLDLLKVAPEIQEQIVLHSRDKDSGVPSGLAVELAKYIPDHQKQRRLLEKIQNEGMSVARAKLFIKNHAGPEAGKPGSRKRQLSDDYPIFCNSLKIMEDRVDLALEMDAPKIIMLFYSRDGKDKARALERLDRIMKKLQKLRETVHNEGSIKDVVTDSVKKLWAADKPGGQGETEE
ncbi:MAG: ParB/RepB/Spo0J family partition protein [Patescibacteria group bacterium]